MERLRHIREQAGYSQQDLADESGVSQHTISEIELGRRRPQGRTLRKLAKVLDVEVADLRGDLEHPLGEAPPSQEKLFDNGELEEERRLAFVQSCGHHAEERAKHYERRLAEAREGGVFAGHEGARVLFEDAYLEYDGLRAFGLYLSLSLAEGLPDKEGARFSAKAHEALRPLAKTVERIGDRAAELAQTEAQKAEVERRREQIRETTRRIA